MAFDMCMWSVRLLNDARKSIEDIIEEEKNGLSSVGNYYFLPTSHLEVVSPWQQKKKRSRTAKRAPDVLMEPPSNRLENETRIVMFTASGRLWQLEYPDNKVAFLVFTLRRVDADSLHIWRHGQYEIQEKVTDELDTEDNKSELGVENLVSDLRSHTPTGKQLATRVEKARSVPSEVADFTPVSARKTHTIRLINLKCTKAACFVKYRWRIWI